MATDELAKQLRQHALKRARAAMWEAARDEKKLLTYAEIVEQLPQGAKYAPNSDALASLLSQISRKSDSEGRGLLSAVVVRANDGLPGPGFFTLAEERGRDISDPQACWEALVAEVRASAKRTQ